MIESSVDDLIEKCVDNKIGYKNPQIAQEQKEKYEDLKSRGIDSVYSITFSDRDLDVRLHWQLYRGDPDDGTAEWCDVSYDGMGRRAEAIATGLRFLKKIARRIARACGRSVTGDNIEWALKDPDEFVKFVMRTKDAVLVQNVPANGYMSFETVPAEAT